MDLEDIRLSGMNQSQDKHAWSHLHKALKVIRSYRQKVEWWTPQGWGHQGRGSIRRWRRDYVKYSPKGKGILRPKNKAGNATQFIDLYKGNLLTGRIEWVIQSCTVNSQKVGPLAYRARARRGHCSKVGGFTCISEGLHAPNWQTSWCYLCIKKGKDYGILTNLQRAKAILPTFQP